MPSKHFVHPGRPVALKLRAGYARVTVSVLEYATAEARVSIYGSQKLLDKITEGHGSATWEFSIPNQGEGGGVQINSFSSGRNCTTTIRGGASGVFVSGGDVQIGNIRAGRGGVGGGRGRVVVDGVDVTSFVREQSGAGDGEDDELTVEAILPAGSSVNLNVDDGKVRLTGELSAQVKTYNADVIAEGMVTSGMIKTYNGKISVQMARGISLETYNGNLTLDQAHGSVMAKTYNGNLHVHAMDSVQIMASSYNGNVTVTKAPGTSPQVMADSRKGRVRQP